MINKSDRIELKDLEIYFLNRLEDLIRGFEDNFADKKTTQQALEQIQAKLAALLELINALKTN